MAYRFLLETPESLAAEASIAVTSAGDTDLLVVRQSSRPGYDHPVLDMAVAAHSLTVINTIYDWFDSLGASRPDVSLILHSGQRLPVEEYDRGQMIAAIRRDQPWVERTIPRIGDHIEETASVIVQDAGTGVAVPPPVTNVPAPLPVVGMRTVSIKALNAIAIRVTDIAKAERFYNAFLGMEVTGRGRKAADGTTIPVEADFDWDTATLNGLPADVVMLENGPLSLHLHRVGLGARLDRAILDSISIRVDGPTFQTIKGECLMRGFETLANRERVFAFRDPFAVVWELTLNGA